MNDFKNVLEENFDTILIGTLIFFLIKEGVEDMETIIALICLFLN